MTDYPTTLPPLRRGRPANPGRDQRIVTAIANGATVEQMARKHGISVARVQQIYNKARKSAAQQGKDDNHA